MVHSLSFERTGSPKVPGERGAAAACCGGGVVSAEEGETAGQKKEANRRSSDGRKSRFFHFPFIFFTFFEMMWKRCALPGKNPVCPPGQRNGCRRRC
jgi:hypothetical protein